MYSSITASIAAVESLGFEHVSHDMCSVEHIELHHHHHQRRNSLGQQRDRFQEQCQQLDCKLRERKRELKRLKKDNELLRQENAALKNEAKEQNMALLSFAPLALHEASDCSLRHAGFMLPRFSGTDPTNFAESWLKSIVDSAALYSWTEQQTFVAAKMALEGEARHWLVALRRDIDNFQEFKVAFARKFGRRETSVARVHLELAKRRKLKGEAVMDYLMDVKHLAKKIQLDEETTMEYAVLGLVDSEEEEFSKATLGQFDTLAELEEYLMERADEARVPCCNDRLVVDVNAKRCYHCGKVGHVFGECKEVIESNVLTLFVVAVLLAVIVG